MSYFDAQNKEFTFNGETVGGISGFNMIDGITKVIEHTPTSGDERNFFPGVADFGFITLRLKRNFDDSGQIAMENARASSLRVPCTLSFLGGPTLNFIGFVTKLPIVGDDNSLGTADAVIKIAGKVTAA